MIAFECLLKDLMTFTLVTVTREFENISFTVVTSNMTAETLTHLLNGRALVRRAGQQRTHIIVHGAFHLALDNSSLSLSISLPLSLFLSLSLSLSLISSDLGLLRRQNYLLYVLRGL